MNIYSTKANRHSTNCFLKLRRARTRVALAAVPLFALGCVGTPPTGAQTRHIELGDLAKITSVSDPQISPDGKMIVFVVSRPNIEKDRNDRELVQIDIASSKQQVLT